MAEKRRKRFFPRFLVRSLAEDIINLMDNNEGRLFALEIMEEIPAELRPLVVDSLSAFYEEELGMFFYLLKAEYGKELQASVDRALEKFQMAGLRIEPPVFCQGKFYRAFATRSRHTGQVTIDVAWINEFGSLDVECFFLSFDADGIQSSFVICEMPITEYERERSAAADLMRISLPEAALLLQQAYDLNIQHMTRPGRGRFLFQKYLDMPHNLTEKQQRDLLFRLSSPLSPWQQVNSLFLALRHQDTPYIISMLNYARFCEPDFIKRLHSLLNLDGLLIEGKVNKSCTGDRYACVQAHAVSLENDELYYSEFSFYMQREGARWLIIDISRDTYQRVNDSLSDSSLAIKVYCDVYAIMDVEALVNSLEDLDNIREVNELPYGVHLRISQSEENLDRGVLFLTGIMADLIINGDELVIITKSQETREFLGEMVMRDYNTIRIAEHEVSALTAYRYLSGQYVSFEDVLVGREESFHQDGMRVLSARYTVLDREQVVKKLQTLASVGYQLDDNHQVYYQYRQVDEQASPELLAEYVLGYNWVTVSAFGERDSRVIREWFERDIRHCLEFEGIEVKFNGIFDNLTPEVKEHHPELEGELKKAYLEKWYRSKLKPLQGMSPAQARQSIEGRRLLWELFKQMSRHEKGRDWGRNNLNLKEYMRKVGV